MSEIIGDATKSRLIAVFIDHFIALAMMLLIVAQVPAQFPSLKALLVFSVYLSYYVLFEGAWSRTPGKFFQGLVVRRLDGRPCDWRGAAIRGLLRIVEVNPLLMGGLPAGLVIMATKRKQRIGDVLAGTVVVSSKLGWEAREEVDAEGAA